MGADQATGKQFYQDLAQDHRGLMERVHAIERFRLTRDDIAEEWAAAVSGELETLVEELVRHFRWEEQGDLYTAFSERFPRFSDTVDRLRGEHQEILGELQAVLGHCDEGASGPKGTELSERLIGALTKLRRHEAQETDIVHRAYNEDIGPGD